MLLAVAIRKAIAAAFATWARASASGSIDSSGEVFSGTSTSTYGMVLASMSLSGKTYFEVDLDLSGETFITGFGAQANDGTTAPIDNFVGYNTTGVAGFPRTGYGWYVYFNAAATSGSPYSAGSSVDPSYRGGVAVDPSTRKVWLRLVWSGGATAWAGGGDPETGTTPTATLGGTDPIYPAACSKAPSSGACTATLLPNPADYYGAAPTGYTAGLSSTPIPFALTGTITDTAQVGVAYSSTLTLSGTFTGPVTIDAEAGTIPGWMSVAVSGMTVTFSGTPDTTTAVDFTPRATDSTSPTAKVAVGTAQAITVSAAASHPTTGAKASTNGGITSAVTTQATGSTFLAVTGEYGTSNTPAPSDNKGNTFSLVRTVSSGSYHAKLWKCVNGIGGSGHTFVDNDTKPYGTLSVIEVIGADTSAPIDVHNGAATSGSGPWGSGSITTSVDNELELAFCVYDFPSSNSGITAVASGWTLEHDTPLGDDICSAISSKVLATAGTDSTSFSSSSANIGLVIVASLKPA